MELFLQTPTNQIVENFFSLKKREDIADLLEIPYNTLIFHLYRTLNIYKYKTFSIPKKSGGERKICAPITTLKILQRKLAYALKNVYRTKPSVHGFVDRRSIVTNATTHASKGCLLNIDIHDFFPSINFGRVRGMFMAKPYNLPEKVATTLAQICCYENQLPQGAPTSPIVSNMICAKMDSELQRIARRYRCTYTRYADDITISSARSTFPNALAKKGNEPKQAELSQYLIDIIEQNGFKINHKKVSLCSKDYRQEVTGLTVNQFPNIKRKYTNQIRAMLHAWEKYGLPDAEREYIDRYAKKHQSPFIKEYWSSELENKSIFREVIIGKLNYLRMVRGLKNPVFIKYCKQLAILDPSFEKTCQAILKKSGVNEYEDSVFVLESIGSDSISNNQATAFILEDIGIISCHHAIQGKVCIYKAYNAREVTYLTVKNIDTARDIAVFELPKQLDHTALSKGDSEKMKIGDLVKVIGFPNYAEGSTIQVYEGRVTGTRQWFGSLRIHVDAAIIKGGSGGPVLNARGQVIGIAATGKDKHEDSSQEVQFGVIPINSVNIFQD